MMKIVGGAILISIPVALLLAIFGRPLIHLIFQHGAFTRHSSALTALVLIGYAPWFAGAGGSGIAHA